MVINIMVHIMNMIHYIYKYDKLKYGLFIDVFLPSKCYESFYEFYKYTIRARIFRGPPTFMMMMFSRSLDQEGMPEL